MSWKLIRTALAVAAVWIAVPAVAYAQIFAWRDANGTLVLSDKPKDPSAKSYEVAPPATVAPQSAVSGAGVYRTTRVGLNRRSELYDALIEQESAVHAVDPNLVRAVIQAESAFNPRARSHKGAMGLMQLMPGTAREYGVLDPYNPVQNIRAGVAYLKRLLVRFADNVELALAAYNAGPRAVERYGTQVPPYRETRNYVARIRKATGQAETTRGGATTRVYRTVEIVDGRAVVKYSGKATTGAEVVASATRR